MAGVTQNLDLFGSAPLFPTADYNGPEYVRERDHARLESQSERIFQLMRDGEWRTLKEIAKLTKAPESSVSAQLRHFRKRRFGSHTIERRAREHPIYEYRLIVNEAGNPQTNAPSTATRAAVQPGTDRAIAIA